MRILVVEDEPTLSDQLVQAISEAGHTVERARDGREAHYLGEVEEFDAVVLDLGLPVLGGLTVLAPFHTLIAWAFAAFIVMHVYLTTTERTPLSGIKSMVTGWSELEVHESAEEA